MDSPAIKRALISVSDKRSLVDFAQALVELEIQIYSTGGTYRLLTESGIAAIEVAAYTEWPEMLDGRVKTLHPKIHGGILARHNRADDMAALARHGMTTFELVVVNLYPFEETAAAPGTTLDEAVEQIDIGGPSLMRGAAKNHPFVTLASDPSQYDEILAAIRTSGGTTLAMRRSLAQAAYARTAEYDTAISGYLLQAFAKTNDELSAATSDGNDRSATSPFPAALNLSLRRVSDLRYGENPHQAAALYRLRPGQTQFDQGPSLVAVKQLWGKELSYNNLLDTDSALTMVASLQAAFPDKAAVVVLKHNNPCGAAISNQVRDAADLAWNGDSLSAFGSVLGFSREVDAGAAELLAEPGRFVEAILAPSFTPAALEILTTRPKWKANVRLLTAELSAPGRGWQWRQVSGGALLQQADQTQAAPAGDAWPDDWRCVTERNPSDAERTDLRFAWEMVRHVKSNAIVIARQGALCGVGAGQMSRVDSVEIAIRKAGVRALDAVLASDAFFPFEDSIHAAGAAGMNAIVQPGGSKRDNECIAACNRLGISMIFTGRRHFKH